MRNEDASAQVLAGLLLFVLVLLIVTMGGCEPPRVRAADFLILLLPAALLGLVLLCCCSPRAIPPRRTGAGTARKDPEIPIILELDPPGVVPVELDISDPTQPDPPRTLQVPAEPSEKTRMGHRVVGRRPRRRRLSIPLLSDSPIAQAQGDGELLALLAVPEAIRDRSSLRHTMEGDHHG